MNNAVILVVNIDPIVKVKSAFLNVTSDAVSSGC